MNKKRPRGEGAQEAPGDNLCRPLLTTGHCQFGPEACRFSHDLVGYLKRKEKVRFVFRKKGGVVSTTPHYTTPHRIPI